MPIESNMINGQQLVELTPDFLGESRHEFVAKASSPTLGAKRYAAGLA